MGIIYINKRLVLILIRFETESKLIVILTLTEFGLVVHFLGELAIWPYGSP